jgi:hypothetical protein
MIMTKHILFHMFHNVRLQNKMFGFEACFNPLATAETQQHPVNKQTKQLLCY